MQTCINKHHLWRDHVRFLKVIRDWITYFPVPELSLLYHETLIEYARDGIKPIQYICLEVIALLLLHNYDFEEAESIIERIISEFAESESSFMKSLFVDFFEICWNQEFTISVIEEKFFDHFIAVSQSPYKSVKLRILKAIPNMKYVLTDSDILEEIQSMLIQFADDRSTEVAMKTEEVNMLLFKWKKEAKTPEGEIEHKMFEEERKTREKLRKEMIKKNKVLMEERKKKEEEEEQK